MVDNSTTRNGLCRSSTHGRFVEGVPMRQNGKRHGMWPPTRPGRCWSNHPFDPSAQPRCGCCEHPPHTRGSAGNGATPGFMTQRLWRCGGGGPQMDADGRGWGRVGGVVVGSGRCRISLRDAGVMRGYTGGVVAVVLKPGLLAVKPPAWGWPVAISFWLRSRGAGVRGATGWIVRRRGRCGAGWTRRRRVQGSASRAGGAGRRR